MTSRKLTALLLCILLLFTILSGCSDADTEDPAPGDDIPPENGIYQYDPDGHIHGVDFYAAFNTFPPETVMIMLGNHTVTWEEFYVFLYRSVMSLLEGYGTIPEWSEVLYDDITLAEAVMDYTVDEVISFKIFEYGADLLGITHTEEILGYLHNDLDGLIDAYGGKEALEQSIWENGGFSSYELFENMIKTEYLLNVIISELYGENNEMISEATLEGYVKDAGYMMAKHILRTKTTDDDDTPLQESEEILKLLNEYDGDDFSGFFDDLMLTHTEDAGGLMSYPNGYLFQFNDMVTPFSEACAALEPGQLSGIVESQFGYHIILRMPVDYDEVPIALANMGYNRTLRQLAALEDFDVVIQGWHDNIKIEYTTAFDELDITTLFVECSH